MSQTNSENIQNFSEKSIGTSVIKLLFGRVGVHLITFASAPVITRLFLPHDFGIFQIFLSIAGVIAVVSCLRYELSIPLGKDEGEASASFVLSLIVACIFALLVLVFVSIWRSNVAEWFNMPGLDKFLWLLPLAIFALGLKKTLRFWVARIGRFGAVAWSEFGSTSVGTSITIVWPLIAGASAAALFFGYLSTATSAILFLTLFLGRNIVANIRKANLSPAVIFAMAKRYKKFPIFSIWSALFNSISVQLPPIILGLYYPTSVVGFYSLGQRIVGIPVMLIGTSIGQVFFPAGAREYRETGTLSKVVTSIFKRLVQIGIFPMVVLIFLGPMLFSFLFGEQWLEAGSYSQILAFWFILVFMYAPLSTVFSILDRQDMELVFNIIAILGRTICLLIGASIWSPRGTLIIFVAFSVLFLAGMIISILIFSKVSVLWALKMMSKYIALSCILIFPVKLISLVTGNLGTILALIFAVVIYITIMLVVDSAFREFARKIFGDMRKSLYNR